MLSRERVAKSLRHKTPDRVPVDLGGQSNTSLTLGAFNALQHFYRESVTETEIMAKHFQTVEVPEDYLIKFGVDFRSIKPGKPKSARTVQLDSGSYIDHWGVTYSPAMGGTYYDITDNPLKDAGIKDIENYIPFDPSDGGIGAGLRQKAEKIYYESEFSLIANLVEAQIFERAWYLRGLDNLLMDMCLDEKATHALLGVVTELQKKRAEEVLKETGEYISIVKVSDDLSGQLSPLFSPEMYRKIIKPYHRDYFDHIKKFTDAPVALHCCGNIRPLLPDIIETGVEIIHPFQFSCPEMEPSALKKEFGKDLVFWGGMDTQKFLPYASVEEVREEVKKIVSIMGNNGGFIFAPTHNLQVDIPAENIVAMYETVQNIN